MRILLVSATSMEMAPLLAGLDRIPDVSSDLTRYSRRGHDVDVLVTGVGMVATATRSADAMARQPYDFALNLGACGTFDRDLGLGTVVHVVSDCLAELGAEDGDQFLTIQDLELLDANEFPYRAGRLVNDHPPANQALSVLPAVAGITVNTVHGNEGSIAAVTARFRPQVESMEGAAFMYACMIRSVSFAQVRAVSNVVEPRNRAAWAMSDAIRNLGVTALRILDCA